MARWGVRLGVGATVGLAASVGVLLSRAALAPSLQPDVPPAPVAIDPAPVADALAAALRIPTVSVEAGVVDAEAHAALRDLLEARFPSLHAALRQERIAEHSLLYTWAGADPAAEPILLLAHLDVVPVDPAAPWTVPPFEGRIADGHVWGRGALDDKQSVIAILSAVEHLIGQGHRPRRTILLAFGHDEESGGSGARAIADHLGGRRLAAVLDEGGLVLDGALDGLSAPAAMIGIAEKGYASVELVARGEGGHSSMPPPSTAAGRIGRAVARIEAHPMPAALAGPTAAMFDALAPEMDWPMRVVLTNRWLFGPVVRRIMERKPSSNATLRTTAAVTRLSGSPKDNVLPPEARATVNFRLLPGDSSADALAHVREVIDDPAIEVALIPGITSEPSPVSRTDGPEWDALRAAIRETWPEAVVAPYLTVGATDARAFTGLSERVWRFSPMRVHDDDLARIHGRDERIAIDELARMVGFYVRFLERTTR